MPKTSPSYSGFEAGEISPLSSGRTDIPQYNQGLARCLNYVITPQGAITRRPGTRFVATITNGEAVLVPFEFSDIQAYILEFTEDLIRFYRNKGIILDSGSSIYELDISGALSISDLNAFDFAQSADVLYIVTSDSFPKKLLRYDHDDWEMEFLELKGGPYMDTDERGERGWTVTPSGTSGSISLTEGPISTLSSGGDFFDSGGEIGINLTSHVYKSRDTVLMTGTISGTYTVTVIDEDSLRLDGTVYTGSHTTSYISPFFLHEQPFPASPIRERIRLLGDDGNWVEALTDYGGTTYTLQTDLPNTNAITSWRMGLYSRENGYPTVVTFDSGRFCLAGCPATPSRIDWSRTGQYTDFTPTDADGTVVADHAISATLDSNEVNTVNWMISGREGLAVGTLGDQWIVSSASDSEPLSPSSISATKISSVGNQKVRPVQAKDAIITIQKGARKVNELFYFFDVIGHKVTEISVLSNHITASGVKQMAYQKEPYDIVWLLLNNGTLVGCTYVRNLERLQASWHRHIIGGQSSVAGTHAIVESIAVIPSTATGDDELWMSVRRHIDGETKRYIEYLTEFPTEDTELRDMVFVDSSLTFRNSYSITGATNGFTQTSPVSFRIESVADGSQEATFDGKSARFQNVVGPTELNAGNYTLTSRQTGGVYYLDISDGNGDIDGTNFTAHEPETGELLLMATTISGFDHLVGETVNLMADGMDQPARSVSTSGEIVLDAEAATVSVGFGFVSDGQKLITNSGSATGAAVGKTRRTHRVSFHVHKSLNLTAGGNFEDLTDMIPRFTTETLDNPQQMFTGIVSENISVDYNFENKISFRQDSVFPTTILAILPQLVVQDR